MNDTAADVMRGLASLPERTDDSYTQGRKEWQERYGDLVVARDQWKKTAFLALASTLLAVGGLVYSATQNRLIPYVIQVDRLGAAVTVGRADQASRIEPQVLRAQLARWVTATRVVYVDAAAQRSAINEAYGMLSRGSAAHNRLSEHFRANTPFARAEKESVVPEVHTVLHVGGNTWRVEWTEKSHGRNGELVKEEEWQASVTVQMAAPSNEETILRNPLGVYVVDFSWTKRL